MNTLIANTGTTDDWNTKLSLLTPKCCRVARTHDTVYNDECVYSFHSPYTSEKGILVNLATFLATCEDYIQYNVNSIHDNDGEVYSAFVRIVKQKVINKKEDKEEGEKEDNKEKAVAITKLGVGIDGGFPSAADQEVVLSKYSIVLWHNYEGKIDLEIPFCEETSSHLFPEYITSSVQSIVQHVGTQLQQDVQAWELEEEPKPVSKFCYTLPFVDNGVTVSPYPKDWRCQMYPHDSDNTNNNLWLNLSDGFIGGGRKHWDGSGGTNGALEHYMETNKQYPLVVKLGTITSDPTTADCYSYDPDEDGPVLIPNLAELLAKRGILVSSLQKTVKSTAELEVELNATYAFDAITEAGSSLIPIAGPGYQGLQNLGNSCYINTVCQALFSGSVPELTQKYSPKQQQQYTAPAPVRLAPLDVITQTIKLTDALSLGTFASVTDDIATIDSEGDAPQAIQHYRLAPRMFKHAICHGHSEFRTCQQQDAAHFLQFLLETLDTAELKNSDSLEMRQSLPSHLFAHNILSRIVCSRDGKVKYRKDSTPSTILSIRIPKDMLPPKKDQQQSQLSAQDSHEESAHLSNDADDGEKAEKKDEDNQQSRESKRQKSVETEVPTISFQTCLDVFHEPSTIDDYNWPHLNHQSCKASVQNGLENFPKYLFVQLLRYELGPNWVPVKIEVNVDVPEQVDLSFLKMTSIPQNGEELVPQEEESGDSREISGAFIAIASQQTSSGGRVVVDEAALSQLMDMGFSLYGCTRALLAAGGSNVEAAMNWIFEHNMDPDFNEPLPEAGPTDHTVDMTDTSQSSNINSTSAFTVDDTVVSSLVESLGCFTFDQVKASLIAAGGAMDRAADWLFSHMDDLDTAIAQLGTNATSAVLQEERQPQQMPAVKAADIALDDGEGNYSLIGCVSHIGKNVGSGHYVCHLKKDGKWIIYNDEKVAISQNPPLQHAYLYLFRRDDATEEAA